jgi:serine protease Do
MRPFRNCWLFILCLTILAGGVAPAFSQTSVSRSVARELSAAFASTAKGAMPAVVSIKIEKIVAARTAPGLGDANDPDSPSSPGAEEFLRRFFGGRLPQMRSPQPFLERGQGSGFLISRDGYILTNNHVVGNVSRMTVELPDGRSFTDAKVVGTDPDTEVALIKIEGEDFPVLPLGDSDRLDVGDWVMAIGSPFGLTQTVTVGVISAVGRSNVRIAAYESFIQTDAAINPGNSGGPLVNLDGRAIGINTAIVSGSGGSMGVGFAIPINMARMVADQLRKTGRVVRGYLGLYAQDVTSDMAQLLDLSRPQGALVAQIENGSPADQAGLEVGDVILEMNGDRIESYDTFRNEIAQMRPGTKVELVVSRDGKTREHMVTLGERPVREVARSEQPPAAEPQQALGVQVRNLTRDLARQLGYESTAGVIVTAIQPGSPGDLILSVNRQSVTSVSQFAKMIDAARKTGKVLLLVRRGEFSQFVAVDLG